MFLFYIFLLLFCYIPYPIELLLGLILQEAEVQFTLFHSLFYLFILQWTAWTRPVRITALVFTAAVSVFRNGPDPDVNLKCPFVLNTALVEGFLRTRRAIANPTGPETAPPVRVYK